MTTPIKLLFYWLFASLVATIIIEFAPLAGELISLPLYGIAGAIAAVATYDVGAALVGAIRQRGDQQ